MQFKDVIGNDGLKGKLASMVDEGRVAHALMLVEEDGWGGLPLAIALAQYMSCPSKSGGDSCGVCPECNKFQKLIHPDMHFVFPVNVTSKSGSDRKPVSDTFISTWRELVLKNPYFTEEQLNIELGIEDKVGNISVAEAKEILAKTNMRSYQGGNKYIIIWLPERMSQEAANKLLKMIEEPFSGTYFLLITHAPERVINTIRSRCLTIQMLPTELPEDGYEVSRYFPMISELLTHCISRRLSPMLDMNEDLVNLGREKQKEFCRYSTAFLRKIWLAKHGLTQIASIKQEELQTIQTFVRSIPDPFFEKAFGHFEGARSAIENNANAKMVFCNLTNLLFVSL
jgi:DNA polymerase-3 subunit delta'